MTESNGFPALGRPIRGRTYLRRLDLLEIPVFRTSLLRRFFTRPALAFTPAPTFRLRLRNMVTSRITHHSSPKEHTVFYVSVEKWKRHSPLSGFLHLWTCSVRFDMDRLWKQPRQRRSHVLPFADQPFEATSKYTAAKTDIIQPTRDLYGSNSSEVKAITKSVLGRRSPGMTCVADPLY